MHCFVLDRDCVDEKIKRQIIKNEITASHFSVLRESSFAKYK